MASKTLFGSTGSRAICDAHNKAGAPAYALSAKHALAQYAATGCFNDTFYATAEDQLTAVLGLARQVDAAFVAKTAVFCRERALMKDMPALLCAVLSLRQPALCSAIFPRVIDDAKMLRNFVQIMRSGVTGRKSLGSLPKRLVRQWLEARSEDALFRASVGQSPSLADIVKMVHPTPSTEVRRAFYGYLLGREHDAQLLPQTVRAFEDFKSGRSDVVPDIPFQLLTALDLKPEHWVEVAKNAGWQMTRMNLNTFERHGVYAQLGMDTLIANRLRNPELIRKARAFPYQLLAAYRSTTNSLPLVIREALQDALEIATANVPTIEGKVYVLVDVSGSMSSPITGTRIGATTALRCIDGAALVAATILRKNPLAEVIPFERDVVLSTLNPRDSVMTNADKLASIGGGGTNCSAPLTLLNRRGSRGDLIVFVSDNESWIDARRGATAVMQEWHSFKARNPAAKMVCIDFVPNATTQAAEGRDILNIGGFSDVVFDLLANFARNGSSGGHWIDEIERVTL